MTFVQAMHYDGFLLVLASIGLLLIGHGYQRWTFRIPVFALGFCDFALGLNLLGLYRPPAIPLWLWLRIGADSATLAILIIYLIEARSHAQRTVPRPR